MAHELASDRKGALMAYNKAGGLPWHGLGVAVDGLQTLPEMMRASRLEWMVRLGGIQTSGGKEIESHCYTYRTDEDQQDHILGVVGKDWTPLQNADFFGLMDRLVGQGYATWETMGALFDGRVVFGSLRPAAAPDLILDLPNGEKLETYLAGLNGHDGTRALEIFLTTIRPVCWNTVSAARDTARARFKARHTSGIDGRVGEIRNALGLSFKTLASLKAQCSHLVEQPYDRGLVNEWLETLFPLKDVEHKATFTKRVTARDEVMSLAYHGKGNDGSNLWSWYNGFTEWADHKLSRSQLSGSPSAMGTRMLSMLAGSKHTDREAARKGLLSLSGYDFHAEHTLQTS